MPVDVFRMQETQTISICVAASCELPSKTKISQCKQAHRQTAVMPHYIVVANAIISFKQIARPCDSIEASLMMIKLFALTARLSISFARGQRSSRVGVSYDR